MSCYIDSQIIVLSHLNCISFNFKDSTLIFQCGRGVPVIIPGEVSKAIQFLADREARAAAGVSKNNGYLFAAGGMLLILSTCQK